MSWDMFLIGWATKALCTERPRKQTRPDPQRHVEHTTTMFRGTISDAQARVTQVCQALGAPLCISTGETWVARLEDTDLVIRYSMGRQGAVIAVSGPSTLVDRVITWLL